MARPKKSPVKTPRAHRPGRACGSTPWRSSSSAARSPRSSPRRTRWCPAPSRSGATRPLKTCTTPSSTPSAAGTSTCTSSSSARGRWTRRHPGTSCRGPSRRTWARRTRRPAGWTGPRIDSLGLEVGRSFGYWFDFGDDWWHQINVEAIEDKVPARQVPQGDEAGRQEPAAICRGRRVGGVGALTDREEALPAGSPAQRKGTGYGQERKPIDAERAR